MVKCLNIKDIFGDGRVIKLFHFYFVIDNVNEKGEVKMKNNFLVVQNHLFRLDEISYMYYNEKKLYVFMRNTEHYADIYFNKKEEAEDMFNKILDLITGGEDNGKTRV